MERGPGCKLLPYFIAWTAIECSRHKLRQNDIALDIDLN